MTVTMRAVFVGDGSLLTRCAQAWLDAGHAIAGVASANAAIQDWAREREVPFERFEAELRLQGLAFDYLFSVVNLRVLPEAVLRRARRLALNFHDGPLPAYAGLNAPAWALMAGARRHGVTWHEMTAFVDRGRIARQVAFDLAPDETAASLNVRCHEAGYETFLSLLDDIGHDDLRLAEPVGVYTDCGRHQRPPGLATLDWQVDATTLCALVRGLDFGAFDNPLALPKLWLGDRVVMVRSAQVVPGEVAAAPGTVLAVTHEAGGRLRIATGAGVLALGDFAAAGDADPLRGIEAGHVIPAVPAAVRERLTGRLPSLARGEAWWRRMLGESTAWILPYPRSPLEPSADAGPPSGLQLALDVREAGADTLAAFCAWLSALTGQEAVSVRYADAVLAEQAQGIEPWASAWGPLVIASPPGARVPPLCAGAQARIDQARQAGPMTCDLPWRLGRGLGHLPLPQVGICLGAQLAPPPGDPLEIALLAPTAGAPLVLVIDTRVYAPEVAQVMAGHLQAWLQAFTQAPGPLADLPLAPPTEVAQVAAFNDTAVSVNMAGCVHEALERHASGHPDAPALRWSGAGLTHAQLQARIEAFARVLRERGVKPGDVVGLCLERSPDMVVALLAILRCGAAYLPLDPAYPPQRLRFMRDDAGVARVVCGAREAVLLGLPAHEAVSPDAAPGGPAPVSWPVVGGAQPAYVIYTSGSTGQPKGVVVTHANVLNFFAGMDARVPHAPGDRWLAVTSLSFDISVLELLWTLSRGVVVVLAEGAGPAAGTPGPAFSLFHFGCHASAPGDRYRLLLEAARFADRNGFEAVWMPERHFHEFGGAYPNPAITAAAVAAVTERVKVRAGSCVLPLHHPVRVAEDWALVDNLSGGRVGVAFAAGWQPQDFVLAPAAFEQRSRTLMTGIDTVRRLWRGEGVEFPGPQGDAVTVRTLPRPLQAQLPVWIAAAANPETFERAGRCGCHVLTHLLGQSIDEVAAKVATYRTAWGAAGHPGQGQVTLMLHTFIGKDEAAVREAVHGPLKDYLRSSVDLIRRADWTFPTIVTRNGAAASEPPPAPEQMDALLEHAVNRYVGASALIGTPEQGLAMVRRVQQAGIDEIACLVDFGIEAGTVLAHLDDLRDLAQQAQRPPRALGVAAIAGALREQSITHLQCTPSMASLLLAHEQGREALAGLRVMLVGGEALPAAQACALRALVRGPVMNMYGPTETTVWSTCCEVAQAADFVPLGTPIANTWVSVRNAWGQECPALVPGEILIGGAGVSQGYLGRPELNAARFIVDPARPGQRLYRTGDLARRHPDGRLEFLGRIDQQVKLRGHRVELGEIEAVLARQHGVHEAVVMAHPDAAGDLALHAFVSATAADPEALRRALALALPDVMVPRRVVVRERLPLTPNGKVDRQALKALCEPQGRARQPIPGQGLAEGLEQRIAQVWREVLGLDVVDRNANFLDIGGHSLAVIQVQRRLREACGLDVTLADMFRLTTVAALAGHAQGPRPGSELAVSEGQSRARARRSPVPRAHGA